MYWKGVLSLSWLVVVAVTNVSGQSFIGCYEDKSQERMFTLSPGDYDPDLLATEPAVCTSRCHQLSYAFAGVWQARFCFCSANVTQTATFNITGITRDFCIQSDQIAVYNAEVSVKIDHIEVIVNGGTDPHLSTSGVHEVKALNSTTPLTSPLSTRLGFTDDRYRIELVLGNGAATNKTYLEPGVYNIRAQAFQYSSTVVGSSAMQIIVSEPVGSVSLSCSPIAITGKTAGCIFTVGAGSNLNLVVNWGEGPTENFTLPDVSWDRAGAAVATQATGMQPTNATYALVAADFKYTGILHAFEFFAQNAGSLDLLVFRPVCSGTPPNYCYSTDSCGAASCYNSIDCSATTESLCPSTESCWKLSGSTCSGKMLKKNVTAVLAASFSVVRKYSVAAMLGYNKFFVTDQFVVQPGDKIGFFSTSSNAIIAARSPSLVEGKDFLISPFTTSPALSSTFSSGALTGLVLRHQLSAVARPISTYKLERIYTVEGNYSVSVRISNTKLAGSAVQVASSNIWIQPRINDTSFVPVAYVVAYEPCNVRLQPHTGVNVMYNWTFSHTAVPEFSNVPVSSHIYDRTGTGYISVTAYTAFESRSNNTSFSVIERVNISALNLDGQIYGRDSLAYVVMATGTKYNCTFNVSTGSIYYFSNNNYTIPPLPDIGMYYVTSTCTNFLTSDTRTSILYVEVPVTLFTIVRRAAEINVPFSPQFSLANGTHPKFGALFDNITRSVTYNPALLLATMESVTMTTVGKYILVGRAYNNISDVLLVTNFTMQERILGLSFTVVNQVVQVNTPVGFRLTMTTGSGVDVRVSFGDGNTFNYTTSEIELWGGRIILSNNTFTVGGDYVVTVNVSNLIGFEIRNITIHVIAPLGTYQLVSLPVAARNTAVGFQIQLISGSQPSLTSATFNWGDGTPLETFTNIQLSNTFNHVYTVVGFYTVSFNASNPIPTTAANSTSIRIVVPITNPRVLFTPPVLAKGDVASVFVTIDTGANVTISLDPGIGTPITHWISDAATNTRTILNSTYSVNGTFLMNLTICNPFSCFTYANNLRVVNKLLSSSWVTTNNGNRTFGQPLVFLFTYTGPNVDAPYGAMIEVRDHSNTVVNTISVTIPVTTVSIAPVNDGYVFYTFYVYNNGSNFTITSPIIGTFTNIANLNFTLKYRTPGTVALSSGYGPNQLMFPNKKDLVVLPSATGYIQSFTLLAEFSPVNISAARTYNFNFNETVYKYIDSTGPFEVTLTAWNPVSSATFSMNITIGGSIIGGIVRDNDGISRPGQPRSVSIVWDIISDDTCVFIDLGLLSLRFAYGPPNCNVTCGSSFDSSYKHTGQLVTNNRIDLIATYATRGTYRVNVVACNDFTNSTITGTLAVSTANCRPPLVTMADSRYSSPDRPKEARRAEIVSIECLIVDLPCQMTLSNRREWFIDILDETSRSVIGSVNASSLPSFGNTLLAIPKFFLNIGLYRVTARVVMNTTVTIEEFANQSSMYLRIGSSSLLIGLNAGGMSEIKASTQRQICLQPQLYSLDPDINTTDLASQGITGWVFHCFQDGETEPADDSRTPVQTPKPDSFAYTGYTPSAIGCFGSPPGFVQTSGSGRFCFDGRNLLANRVYNFKVQGFKGTRVGKALFKMQAVSGQPANVNIRCRFTSACRRVSSMADFQIINPSDTVQLSGVCNSSDSDAVCQTTKWEVKHYSALNTWLTLDNSQRDFFQGVSNNEVSISPNLFGSFTSRKFRVCLGVGVGTVYEGEGCIQLFTNTVPTIGSCQCNSTNGIAGVSVFNITCSGFYDEDGIDSYQFLLETDANVTVSTTLIGYSQFPYLISTFPYLSGTVRIRVIATDIFGATAGMHYSSITLTLPSPTFTDSVIGDILNGKSPMLKTLSKGNLQDVSNDVQSVAAMVVAASRAKIHSLSGATSVTTAGSGYNDETKNGERLDQVTLEVLFECEPKHKEKP